MREREELAWAAGLFDGEGHISCRERRSKGHFSRNIVMTVAQNHPEVLERFRDAVDLGKIHSIDRYRPAESKLEGGFITYSWRTGRFEHIQAAAAMIWPWLGSVKRAQIAEMLKFYHSLRPSRGVRRRA